jgi:uncharacterized glyoxalase superfamily protein PhnB
MTTQISPMLAVNAAIAFYQAAFGAQLLWHLGSGGDVVAGLFVGDPMAVHRRALGAGTVEHSPVEERTHETIGPKPIKRMLQGALVDPFGHMWLIGKILD